MSGVAVRLLALAALAALAMGVTLETEHVACPCDTPGAFLQEQLEEPGVENLVSLEATQTDLNSTGAALPDGSLDFTKSTEPIDDPENASVCVCKRMHRPKAPVRCTRPDLLHEDCNERDKFREQGYEPAPAHLLTTLYPDEIPQPAGGKLFQDELVEKSAVKNLAVEDSTVRGFTNHIEHSNSQSVVLSSSDLKIDAQAPAQEAVPEPVEAPKVAAAKEPVEANENAGGLGYESQPVSQPETLAKPEQQQPEPAAMPAAAAAPELVAEPSLLAAPVQEAAPAPTAVEHKSPEKLEEELRQKAEETAQLKKQLAALESQMEKLIKGVQE